MFIESMRLSAKKEFLEPYNETKSKITIVNKLFETPTSGLEPTIFILVVSDLTTEQPLSGV